MKRREKARRRTGTLAPGREPLTSFQMATGRYVEDTHGDPDRPMFEQDAKGRVVQVGFHERKGLRAADPLDRIAGLSRRAMEAGRLYIAAWQTVHIGLTNSSGVSVYVHPAHRLPHSEAVSRANDTLLAAARLAGLQGVGAINLCLIAGEPLETAYARLWPAAPACIPRTAGDRVLAALTVHLERLADAWGL